MASGRLGIVPIRHHLRDSIAACPSAGQAVEPKEHAVNSLIPERLDAFLDTSDEGPITMLNLLRFKADGGRQRYAEYLAMAGPIVARLGAEIVFAGDSLPALAAEEGQAWDAVALVRYPNRRAFGDLINDADYAVAHTVGRSALEEAVLQPLKSMAR